jgi:hypothetical protein
MVPELGGTKVAMALSMVSRIALVVVSLAVAGCGVGADEDASVLASTSTALLQNASATGGSSAPSNGPTPPPTTNPQNGTGSDQGGLPVDPIPCRSGRSVEGAGGAPGTPSGSGPSVSADGLPTPGQPAAPPPMPLR